MIYVCLLPLYQFINDLLHTIEKRQYYVSFIKIAGISIIYVIKFN